MHTSIIIAAHNEGTSLPNTIRSCVDTCADLDHEIIVADDASTDGSVDQAISHFPQIRVTRHDRRLGASPTKQLGARAARGDTLVFLDAHCKPEMGGVCRLSEGVELADRKAIITPEIPTLDVDSWRNSSQQVGCGYSLRLKTFESDWLPPDKLRAVSAGGRPFHESPALIGCAFAIDAAFYERLWGFDSHMLMWGVEDLDLGLKCWLMGGRILHDSQASIGHRFRDSFDNYVVPPEQVLVNQLRMARKHFTHSVWADWLERCRRRNDAPLPEHPEGLWARAWELFEQNRASVEQERGYLQANRVRDEFWFANRFGLQWPRLAKNAITQFPGAPLAAFQQQQQPSPSPSPSPSPCPGVTVSFSPSPVKTGFTRPADETTLARTLTATVEPKARVADISFRMAGKNSGLASLGPVTKDTTNGTALFDVKGKGQSTNISVTKIEAVCEGRVLASVEVKVLVPKRFATPFPEVRPAKAPTAQNMVGSNISRPPWYIPGQPLLDDDERGLATLWYHVLTVGIRDQFGDVLDSIYDGNRVEERVGTGPWIYIQDVNGGSYPDPVGPYFVRGQTQLGVLPNRDEYIVDEDDPLVDQWPNDPLPTMPVGSGDQDIDVKVAGHGGFTIKRRWISTRVNGQDMLEIQWPPD